MVKSVCLLRKVGQTFSESPLFFTAAASSSALSSFAMCKSYSVSRVRMGHERTRNLMFTIQGANLLLARTRGPYL